MGVQQIDLSEILTEEEIGSLPFSIWSDCYVQDFIRACKAANGGSVYTGTKDTYFPDPCSLTEEEMQEHAKFLHFESVRQGDTDECLDNVLTSVYDAAQEIDERIVQKVLAYAC